MNLNRGRGPWVFVVDTSRRGFDRDATVRRSLTGAEERCRRPQLGVGMEGDGHSGASEEKGRRDTSAKESKQVRGPL